MEYQSFEEMFNIKPQKEKSEPNSYLQNVPKEELDEFLERLLDGLKTQSKKWRCGKGQGLSLGLVMLEKSEETEPYYGASVYKEPDGEEVDVTLGNFSVGENFPFVPINQEKSACGLTGYIKEWTDIVKKYSDDPADYEKKLFNYWKNMFEEDFRDAPSIIADRYDYSVDGIAQSEIEALRQEQITYYSKMLNRLCGQSKEDIERLVQGFIREEQEAEKWGLNSDQDASIQNEEEN